MYFYLLKESIHFQYGIVTYGNGKDKLRNSKEFKRILNFLVGIDKAMGKG